MISKDTGKYDRRLAAIGIFFIGCYFFRLTRKALRLGFSADDLMNLHRSWYFPLSALIKSNLLFFLPSDFIRPFGSVWYRSIYYFAGFHGGLFHASDLAILMVNIFLTYAVARRISGSRLAALAAALLCCYRRNSEALYFDTGYIYDTLCYFFMFAIFLRYLAIRQWDRQPGIAEVAGMLALFACALNSKELAVALPVVLALYEFLYQKHRSVVTILAMGAMDAAMILWRIGPLAKDQAYHSVFTWARFMETNANFLNELFNAGNYFTPAMIVAFWGALLLIAALARSKRLFFAWAFFFVASSPIAFVPPRGASQYYIPTFGVGLYAGCLMTSIASWVARWTHRKFATPYWAERVAATCLLCAIAFPLYGAYKRIGMQYVSSMADESPIWMGVSRDILAARPTLPADARVLLLNDPMRTDFFDLLFLVRLSYRDRNIAVDRVKVTHRLPSPGQMQAYDAVFDCRDGKMIEIPQAPIAIHPVMQALFDDHWQEINAKHPARPGERILVKAVDLGPTDPQVAPGEPFPLNPFATSIPHPNVLVNGRSAHIILHFGSPGEVNLYRFDFMLPAKTEDGMAKVELAVGGQKAPPVTIPVRH